MDSAEWYVRQLIENPPGEQFVTGDPLGRHPLPRRRVWGLAVWSVVVQGEFRNMHAGRGVRHMERSKFKYVILGAVMLLIGLSVVLLHRLGMPL